jgi:hypothetical protein
MLEEARRIHPWSLQGTIAYQLLDLELLASRTGRE